MNSVKIIDGIKHVWSIMDNARVTLDYWERMEVRP